MDSLTYQQQIQELDKNMRHHLSSLLRVDFSQYHITDIQYSVLATIQKYDGIAIGSLATQMYQDAGNMSTLCKKLEKLHYLTREKSKQDERVIQLHLTKDGEQCVNAIHKKIHAYYEQEWNRYTEKDKELILHALTKLNTFFFRISKKG